MMSQHKIDRKVGHVETMQQKSPTTSQQVASKISVTHNVYDLKIAAYFLQKKKEERMIFKENECFIA